MVVTNARGVFSRPIAEYVLMMILSVSRRLPQLLELQQERTWQPLEGAELRDVTVGIVGLGSIGRAVGALATAFGCRVVAVRRRPGDGAPRRAGDRAVAEDASVSGEASERSFGEAMLDRVGGPETLPELLGESDFIVLAAPLTPETEVDDQRRDAGHGQARRLADQRRARPAHRRARAAARPARGPARRRGPRHVPRRAAAGDRRRSTTCENVIVTPHTAWSSGRVLDRSVELFCDNLRRFAAGEPLLNVVDPAAGY